MAIGFSVGDFMAGANLAIQLFNALSDARGSAKEYRELIAELNVVHKVLLQVDQLQAANQLAQATVNALLFTVNAANETMISFLDQYHYYEESLRQGGSRNVVKDSFRKGKWAFQMPDQILALRRTLDTTLAAINVLVSLATYYNTGYDPRCEALIQPSYFTPTTTKRWEGRPWQDVKIEAHISGLSRVLTLSPDFANQENAPAFFRPGQIFITEISSSLSLTNDRRFRDVDFGNLPLDPISMLKATADQDRVKDREKRLEQIWQLPLLQMTAYCTEVPLDKHKVTCTLGTTGKMFSKDEWTLHFRQRHWQYYFSMVPQHAKRLRTRQREQLIPEKDLAPNPLGSTFSEQVWITLDDVTQDVPIMTDDEMIRRLLRSSPQFVHPLYGPVMIQRFVVVRAGLQSCLCLGIHTYAHQGCAGQPNQELYAILQCGKETPMPLPDETRMILSPIRMKTDHPSTALPRSARIHFGRAYEVDHFLSVQSIGLVHPTSMETLINQFDANVFKPGSESSLKRARDANEAVPDSDVKAADMEIVKAIRSDITEILGSKLSPAENRPALRKRFVEPAVVGGAGQLEDAQMRGT